MKEFRYHEKAGEVLKQVEEGVFLVVKGKEKTNVMTIGWALMGVRRIRGRSCRACLPNLETN